MNKCLDNYTLNELKELLPHIPYYKIEICYDYCKNKRKVKVDNYARSKGISIATLYRYIRDIKKGLETIKI